MRKEIQEVMSDRLKKDLIDDKEIVDNTNREAFIRIAAHHLKSALSENFAVLGIDIYEYSKKKPVPQALVPFVFDSVYEETTASVIKGLPYVFQDYHAKKDFEDHFIGTGDGGFQIFDTPLHALLFAVMFELNLRTYNAGRLYPALQAVVEDITLRFALTYDIVYRLRGRYYGTAIIRNARILSRDRLNRCLLDKQSYDWFLNRINGLENLQAIELRDIADIDEFRSYDDKPRNKPNLIIPEHQDVRLPLVRSLDVLKIGRTKAKQDDLDIYGLHMQVTGRLEGHAKMPTFTVTLGNLYTEGLTGDE